MNNHTIFHRTMKLGLACAMLLTVSGCGTFYGYHEPKPRRIFYVDACEVQREKEAQKAATDTDINKTTDTREEISSYSFDETSSADDTDIDNSVQESDEYEPADIMFYTQTPSDEEDSHTTYEIDPYTPEPYEPKPYDPEKEMK